MKKIFKFGIVSTIAAGAGVLVGICAKKILKKMTKFVDDLSDECECECEKCCDECCECECHCSDVESDCVENNESDVEEFETPEDFYSSLSVPELRSEAKALGIKGIWSMNKGKLIAAICSTLASDEVEVTDTTTEEQW